MSNRRLPSLTKDKWNTDVLSPQILALEVYKEKISPEYDPMFYILLEKKEIKSAMKGYGLDTLTISYRVLNMHEWGGYGWLGASYDHSKNTVSITSDYYGAGAVFLDPNQIRGYKIGTYIMNQIIIWAKQYPDATLETISLFENQAEPENKERRNRFYEQFGIQFNFIDEKRESGISKENILIKQLNSVESWKININEVTIEDKLIKCMEVMENQKYEISSLKRANVSLMTENRCYLYENIFQFIWRKIKKIGY